MPINTLSCHLSLRVATCLETTLTTTPHCDKEGGPNK